MSVKTFFLRFFVVFAIAFVVNLVVVYLWEGAFNFEKAFFFGITFGIIFPLAETLGKKSK